MARDLTTKLVAIKQLDPEKDFLPHSFKGIAGIADNAMEPGNHCNKN